MNLTMNITLYYLTNTIYLFGENTEEYIAFEFQYKTKLQDLIKMEKELQSPYFTK